MFAMRQHRTIPGDDDLRASGKRTFQDSIVGLVGEHGQRFSRLDEFTHLGKKDGDARERLAVMGKLPGENGEELVENGSGKGERILAVDDLSERLVTSSAWQRKRRYQHVRVEYDPHARRYRRRSSSVKTPSSFALRLQ